MISYTHVDKNFKYNYRFNTDYDDFVAATRPLVAELVKDGTVVAFQKIASQLATKWSQYDGEDFQYVYFTKDASALNPVDKEWTEIKNQLNSIKVIPAYTSYCNQIADCADYKKNPQKWTQLKMLETVAMMSSIMQSFDKDIQKTETINIEEVQIEVDWSVFDRIDVLGAIAKLDLVEKASAFNGHADFSDYIQVFTSGGRAQVSATKEYLEKQGISKDMTAYAVWNKLKAGEISYGAVENAIKDGFKNMYNSNLDCVDEPHRGALQSGLIQVYKDDSKYRDKFKSMQGQTFPFVTGASIITFSE